MEMTKDELLIEYLAAHILMCLLDQAGRYNYENWVPNGTPTSKLMTVNDIRTHFCSRATIQASEVGDDIPF